MFSKILGVLICLLGILHSGLAQKPEFNDSVEVYEYWAKRGIIEMTYAYMQDQIVQSSIDIIELEKKGNLTDAEKVTLGRKRDNLPKEVINSKEFRREFLIDSNFVDLEKVNNFLSDAENYWTWVGDNIFINLKKELITTKPDIERLFFKSKRLEDHDKYVIIGTLTLDRKTIDLNSIWGQNGLKLVAAYNEALTLLKEKREGQEENPVTPTPDEEGIDTDRMDVIDAFSYITLALIVGLILGGLFVFQYSKNRVYKILEVEKGVYKDELRKVSLNDRFSYFDIVYFLKLRKDEYKEKEEESYQKIRNLEGQLEIAEPIQAKEYERTIGDLKNENQVLEDEKKQLERYIDELRESQKRYNRQEADDKESQDISSSETLEQYFTMPQEDGSFKMEHGETDNDGNKHYKIVYESTAQEGKLYYVSNDRDIKAINRLQTYLKPVCEITNFGFVNHANGIEHLRAGKVFLKDDTWFVDPDNKVKIRLC